MDDFSSHPQTVGEARSERTGSAADWTPRDVLVNILRDIDVGLANPDVLVVSYRTFDEAGNSKTGFTMSSKDPLVSLGLLHRTIHRIQISSDAD